MKSAVQKVIKGIPNGERWFETFKPLTSIQKFNADNSVTLKVSLKSSTGTNPTEDFTLDSQNVLNHGVDSNGNPYFTFNTSRDAVIESVLNSNLISRTLTSDEVPRKVLVEYSSPNIAKPFHLGHFRSTVVGNFIANIEDLKSDVTRLNYLGDWGTQFGLIQVGLQRLGTDLTGFKGDPLKVICQAYVEASKDAQAVQDARILSANLESGNDVEAYNKWDAIRRFTVKHLEDTYKLIGVRFDVYDWESNYTSLNTEHVLNSLKDAKLTTIKDGQLGLQLNDKFVPLLKSDGTSLYLSRDIGAVVERVKKFNCQKILYVVDKSQSEHFTALRHAARELTGVDVVHHVPFGRIIGMSTRMGTGVFLSDIVEKAAQLTKAQQDKSPNTRTTSEDITIQLGISNLLIYVLKPSRTRDIRFDWDQATQAAGDTGSNLQYTHCRLWSLENSCGIKVPDYCVPSLLGEQPALDLISELSKLEEVIFNVKTTLEPHVLVHYMFRLNNKVSKCLKVLPVKGQANELAQQRLLLFHTSRAVLNKCMILLGLQPLNQI